MRRHRQISERELKHEIKKVKCGNPDCEKEFYKFTSFDRFCPYHRYEVRKKNIMQQTANKRAKTGRKVTGERAMFLEIWNERPHVSELSGKPLLPYGHALWHWQFAHVLNKLRFPSMRLNKENILLCLPTEQDIQDQFKVFQDRKEQLKNQIYKK